MGVNEGIYKNLKLKDCNLIHIKWLTPFKDEPLPDYAIRLSKQIDITQPFALMGVSFGGMCCVEIAKKLNPAKVFLVSSCKTITELPGNLKIWSKVPLYKRLSDNTYIKGAMFFKKKFGVSGKEPSKKFKEMLNTAPKDYFKGAVHCLLTWENQEVPKNTIHIHGTADQVLPYKNSMNCNYSIQGGTHLMIIDKAEEISEIINRELKGL